MLQPTSARPPPCQRRGGMTLTSGQSRDTQLTEFFSGSANARPRGEDDGWHLCWNSLSGEQGWSRVSCHSLWGYRAEQSVGNRSFLRLPGVEQVYSKFCLSGPFVRRMWFFFKFAYIICLIKSFRHLHICFLIYLKASTVHLFILCNFCLTYKHKEWMNILSF